MEKKVDTAAWGSPAESILRHAIPTVPPFPEETSSMNGVLFYGLFLLGLILFLGALFYNRRKGK